MTGIYKIQSIINPDRIYIGSAKDIDKRWREHKRDLLMNRHKSQKLQRHYNKYGELDFIYTILICCEIDELISKEQFFIDSLKPYFNTNIIANSPLGLKRSQETKDKISAKNKGKYGNRNGVKIGQQTIIKRKITILINSVNKCIDCGYIYYTPKEKKIIKDELRNKKRIEKIQRRNEKRKIRTTIYKHRKNRHSSFYKGVYVSKQKRNQSISTSIRSFINNNGKLLYLGTFKTENEAATAYNKKAIELYGENAILNEIK